MRYQCLVLDHDDTVVNSTATINYPAFVQTLQKLRPDVHMTLDDFFSYSFEPGFGALCSDILGFSDVEIAVRCAHGSSAKSGRPAHWRTERYFSDVHAAGKNDFN